MDVFVARNSTFQNKKKPVPKTEPAFKIFESGSLISVFVFDVAGINRDG